MENLLPANSDVMNGKQQEADKPSKRMFNIVAKLTGWGPDGSGRVEIMTPLPNYTIKPDCSVTIAEDIKRRHPIDFAFRKKQGLRIGGIVLLRRAYGLSASHIECKEIDILSPSPKDGPCVINRGAAVFIQAPENADTKIPRKATIASIKDAAPIRTINQAILVAEKMIEDVGLFGHPGLIVTGIDSDGDIIELSIDFQDRKPSKETIEQRVNEELYADSLQMMKKSKKAWVMVPTFTSEVDPDPHRQGKISAQYANVKYGTLEEPLWTRTNAVLKGSYMDWFIADVSIDQEPALDPAKLLYELI